jgi:hypothetical protein
VSHQVPRRHNVCRGGPWRNRPSAPLHDGTLGSTRCAVSVQSRWWVGNNSAGPRPCRRQDRRHARITAPIGGICKSEVVNPRLRPVSLRGVVSPVGATGDYQAALSDYHNKPSPGCPIPANRSPTIHPTMEITQQLEFARPGLAAEDPRGLPRIWGTEQSCAGIRRPGSES